MKFKSVSVNNCYILRDKVFDTKFFTYINAKAIYSASIFHLGFFKGNIDNLTDKQKKEYENLSIDLFRINSPYLYIPFEINYHENTLYHSYYESDHFPLSVWIEEKNLIPYNIFIRIIEDILNGLFTLEKAGHSHLLLTPEEILIPLQWNDLTHTKIYNIGLNSIVSSLLTKNEIIHYREGFCLTNSNYLETSLIKNISEDIYAFGKIIKKITPLCNFNNEEDHLFIQNILNKIVDNPKMFNSISEVKILFDSIFSEEKNKTILPSQTLDYSYTGQASFEIPEFDEWQVEAVLEPFEEDEEPDDSQSKFQKEDNSSNFLDAVVSIVSKIFRKKKRSNSASNTINEYADNLEINNKHKIDVSENREYNTDIESKLKTDYPAQDDHVSRSLQTKKILEEIDNHFKVFTENNLKNANSFPEIDQAQTIRPSIEEKRPSKEHKVLERNYQKDINNRKDSSKSETNNTNIYSKNDIFTDFNISLQERDYIRTYDIIKGTINGKYDLEKTFQVKDLKNVLDEKLKHLDEHYIIDEKNNILVSLLKLDSLNPMPIAEKDKEDISKLKQKIEQESENFSSFEIKSKKDLNIFLKILEYLKSQYRKLTKK